MADQRGGGVQLRGRSFRVTYWVIVVVVTVLAVAAVATTPHSILSLAAPAVMAVSGAVRRDDRVWLTSRGIEVQKRRKPLRVYLWDELLEVGWGRGPHATAGPIVRTAGGSPFESPSPGVPSVIALLYRPTQETKDALAQACVAHGVPYNQTMQTDIEKGRRRVRLSSDAERRAVLESRRSPAE